MAKGGEIAVEPLGKKLHVRTHLKGENEGYGVSKIEVVLCCSC